jgi:hypothetical protein
VEGRLQFSQRLQRRVPPRPFVGRKGVRAGKGGDARDGDGFVAEAAGVDRRNCALVAAERERVLLLARDAVVPDVILGDQAVVR